jgi:hypothetical protein
MNLRKQWTLHYSYWGGVPWNCLSFSVRQKQVCATAFLSWPCMVPTKHTCIDVVKHNSQLRKMRLINRSYYIAVVMTVLGTTVLYKINLVLKKGKKRL